MSRRSVLIIVAVVVAALGSALVFVYANGANNRALADQSPVKVLVAKTTIAAGTTASQAAQAGAFELKTISAGSKAQGALSDVTPIADQVALAPVFPGEQVLSAQWGAAGAASSLPIPAGKLAIALQLGDPQRVAGFVNPGSNVAIYWTANDTTRVLLAPVQVIAVGPTTAVTSTTKTETGATNTEQLPRAIMTLALSQTDAAKVIQAQASGSLYFALLNNDSKVTPGGPVSAASLGK